MTEALMNAVRDLLAARQSTYKARNGREMGIEDSSGEKCWIVPFDDMARLEAEYVAIDAKRGAQSLPQRGERFSACDAGYNPPAFGACKICGATDDEDCRGRDLPWDRVTERRQDERRGAEGGGIYASIQTVRTGKDRRAQPQSGDDHG